MRQNQREQRVSRLLPSRRLQEDLSDRSIRIQAAFRSAHYVDVSTAGPSTSKNYVQVPQYQVLSVGNHASNGKKAGGKNGVHNDHPTAQPMQVIMSNGSQPVETTDGPYCIPISGHQMGGQYQMVSGGNFAPMQVINLPEGASFVPVMQPYPSASNHQKHQPTFFQTPDGQQIQLVFGEDPSFHPPPATVAVSVANEQVIVRKSSDDSPLYVNGKQYARIVQRRGARAKLLEEGRITKERRKFLHESRHAHALKRVRGVGGKFDAKGERIVSENEESVCSSPNNSIKREDSVGSNPEKKSRPSCQKQMILD